MDVASLRRKRILVIQVIRIRNTIQINVKQVSARIVVRNVIQSHPINQCISLQSQINHVNQMIENHETNQRITNQEKRIVVDKKDAEFLHLLL